MKSELINLLTTFRELGVDFLIIRKKRTTPAATISISKPFFKETALSRMDPAEDERFRLLKLDKLRQEVEHCQRCELYQSKTKYVFGEGKLSPDLMFVGEAPGKTEDQTGRPFVGEAGQLLEKLINRIGYQRSEIYIGNIIKCRPPGNRTPTAVEAKQCFSFLQRQIEIIHPKVIVALGNVALNYLLNNRLQISRSRGKVFEYSWGSEENPLIRITIPVVATYHPAFLVREKRKEELIKLKWQMLEDVNTALKELKKI